MVSIEFHHMGAVVQDLEEATRFFVALGFIVEGQTSVEGSNVDRIIGLSDVQAEMVMVSAPDGSGRLELSKFYQPVGEDPPAELASNAFGYRHICYQVSDVAEILKRARLAGYGTVGDVVDYANVYRIAYIRGPEGLIVEVAQPLNGDAVEP